MTIACQNTVQVLGLTIEDIKNLPTISNFRIIGTRSWHIVLQPSHLFSFQQVFLYFFGGGITRYTSDVDTFNFSSSQTQNSWEYRISTGEYEAGNVKNRIVTSEKIFLEKMRIDHPRPYHTTARLSQSP